MNIVLSCDPHYCIKPQSVIGLTKPHHFYVMLTKLPDYIHVLRSRLAVECTE